MPRKREAETYDDDGGFVADAPKSKKPKAGSEKAKATVSATAKEGSEGDAAGFEQRKGKGEDGGEFWSISEKGHRRVTVSEFKGSTMVGIREFYEAGGRVLPGKKGISLTTDQFANLVALLPEIEAALKEKGVEVPRPVFGGGVVEGHEGDEAEEEKGGKKNFEETSEEGE